MSNSNKPDGFFAEQLITILIQYILSKLIFERKVPGGSTNYILVNFLRKRQHQKLSWLLCKETYLQKNCNLIFFFIY